MEKNILIIYYSQSGQMREIQENLVSNIDANIYWAQIKPANPFPFPWNSRAFFDAMPESVKLIPSEIETLDIDTSVNYDLVILGFPVWFLSPAIPFTSFLKSPQAKNILNNKPVVTVIGSRNMWIAAQEDVKKMLIDVNANLVGNIVLRDRTQNLISVVTIVHWLFSGLKTKYKGVFPKPGVSDKDIKECVRFGENITDSLLKDDFTNLQSDLLKNGAVDYLIDIASMELKAKRIFNIWANIILNKEKKNKRDKWVTIFKYYLFAVIILLSPIVSILVYLTYPLFFPFIVRKKRYYTSCRLK